MSLNLSSESTPVAGDKITVLRRIATTFNPDGSIGFEGSLCDRIAIEVDGDVKHFETNFRDVQATYPSEELMIALAARNWAPTAAETKAMASAMAQGPTGVVSVILSGFAAISRGAIQTLLTPDQG